MIDTGIDFAFARVPTMWRDQCVRHSGLHMENLSFPTTRNDFNYAEGFPNHREGNFGWLRVLDLGPISPGAEIGQKETNLEILGEFISHWFN